MQRRNFIMLLGGAVGWPLAVRAQQPDRVRQIGVLMPLAADEPEAQTRITAFQQELQQLGWTIGRNVRIDMRLVTTPADIRKHAAETSRLRRTSSSRMVLRPWSHCCRRPAACRSCSRLFPIRADLSIVWRSRAAMPPGS